MIYMFPYRTSEDAQRGRGIVKVYAKWATQSGEKYHEAS